MAEQSRRLDSWKEIADYVGKDVRTAMRWAKSDGLPVRRVAGVRGRSVFAFTGEIDAWLAGGPDRTADPAPASEHANGQPPSGPARSPAAPSRRPWLLAGAGLTTIALAGAGIARWSTAGASPDPAGVRVAVTEAMVALTEGDGPPRQIYGFDADLPPTLTAAPARLHDADANGVRDVLVGVSTYIDHAHRTPRSGELINLSTEGRVLWRFTFDDVIAFRDERFDGPWGVTDWNIGPAASPARIAVAAHHHTWWASMAVVLDHRGQRVSTFINPGWIEWLLWLDADRLAASGFNNAQNAAIVSVIDVTRPHSVAPGSGGTPYACVSCAGVTPLYYATFPRSEINILTAGRFNRARVSREQDRIIVRTVEIDGNPLSATAIYEFDQDMRLRSARYDDVYWTWHERLEREGRLTHAREACPERDGPREIRVWADAGWQTIAPPR